MGTSGAEHGTADGGKCVGNIMGFDQTLKGLGREGSSFKHNLFMLFHGFAIFNLLNMDLASIHRQ